MYGCTYTLPYRYVPQPWGVREVKFSEQVVDDSGVGNVIKEWSETINWPEILPIGAPRFKAFVESCWGQDPDFVEKCRGLQEAIAVTMYGYGTKMQRAFCLIGPPKSGKSQMLKIVEHIIPKEMQCAIGPEGWGDKFLPAELHTKLLNICGELSERRKIDGTKFKEIISGDTITVQFKHQQPFRFEPLATHWFASNHTPRTEDTSEGFNRRWLLLTYNHITSDKEKVLEIGTLIAAEEREVIASWAVQSFPTVVKKKDFTLSASHWERIREIAASNNSLLHFVRDSRVLLIENTVMSKGTPIAELDLYNAYFTFAIASGAAKVVPLLIFRAKMRELGQLLGFTTVITTNAHGNQECFYQNLTFAKNSKGQPKTLN
jgi:P4 family phage/plasmid primase-like protien